MLHACRAANKISRDANAEYRERAKDWLEKHADADAQEDAMPAARGPTCQPQESISNMSACIIEI